MSLGTQLLFALWQDIVSEQMSLFAGIDSEPSRTKGCSLWAHLHPNRWLLWAQDGPLWSPSVLYPWTAVPTWLQMPPFLPPLSVPPTPGAAVPPELAAPYRPAPCMCSSPECHLSLCGTPGPPRGPAPLGPPRSGCFLLLTPGPAGWGWRYTLGPLCRFLFMVHSSQKPRPQPAPLPTLLVGATVPSGATRLCVSPSRAEPPLLQGASDSLLVFGVSGLGLLPPAEASPISHPIATMWYQGLNRFMISGSTQALAPLPLPHSLTWCSAHGPSPAPGDRGAIGSLPLMASRSFLVHSDPKSVSMVAPTPSPAVPVPAPRPQPHWARSCPL